MKLYHPHTLEQKFIALSLLFTWLLGACATPEATKAKDRYTITADGKDIQVEAPAGSTVQRALELASISLGPLDRTEPAAYTVLSSGAHIRLIRVTEKFDIQQVVIPFQRQILRNESLALDREVMLQKGKNGLEEITYRRVYEDGVEVTDKPIPIKSVIVEDPLPEIVMIGIQAPFHSIAIPGRIYYLRDGNVWLIENSTGNRRALVTTGDLDGRIFSLSSDGTWLLFTRRSAQADQINNLWAVDVSIENGKLIDLSVPNVIHFADWLPDSNTKIIFSTVEPRATAPGWQANNDLNTLTFAPTNWTTKWTTLLDANTGGVYGWWGTDFLWTPAGQQLGFARPDSIGSINFKDGQLTTLLEIVPYQTRGDWAWVPGITWGPDGRVLYSVDHVPPTGSTSPEESQVFDLVAIPVEAGKPIHLVSQSGMFAYPLASPLQPAKAEEIYYQVAYLQAIFPTQSETSRYRLSVLDRDGSNQKILFPAEGLAGISPQKDWGAWSPSALPDSSHFSLAVIYQGNLWIVDALDGQAQQITGDGLTSRVIWK